MYKTNLRVYLLLVFIIYTCGTYSIFKLNTLTTYNKFLKCELFSLIRLIKLKNNVVQLAYRLPKLYD